MVSDAQKGLLRCDYCRNLWVDERFVQLSETERFLREQAKQPKVILDNTTETDRQLMSALGGLISIGSVGASIGRTLKTVLMVVIALIVLVVIIVFAVTIYPLLPK
jgi:uncharacterized membrane protein